MSQIYHQASYEKGFQEGYREGAEDRTKTDTSSAYLKGAEECLKAILTLSDGAPILNVMTLDSFSNVEELFQAAEKIEAKYRT